jgi:Cu(I)/Ag(I) efflux system membrane fusion protein
MSRILYAVLALALAGLAAAGGYWYAISRMHAAPAEAATAPPRAAQGDRKVLYWYDPMYPQQRFDKPGKSPFMDMQLVPKYADEGGGEGAVAISPRVVQNLGVRTAEARPGSLAPRLTAVGNVDWNERSVVLVQPRTNGFVERLHVRAPLDAVRAGDPLVEILFPDWAGAQAEYLALKRLTGPEVEPLVRAARERLVLVGMSEEQIAAVERDGKVQARVTLRAPVSGVVAELGAREGMTVSAGTTLFRIASLGTVWIVAEVPEAQAGLLVPGERAEVRVPAYPDDMFTGRVGAILPEVNAATRTVRARVEVANPAGKLKPGMYATLALAPRGREGLLVPSEAVIRTGERSVVILAESGGTFRAIDVEVGMESGADAEIRKGLKAGDRVVVSGQFLIDSEASLRTTLTRLDRTDAAAPAAATLHRGTATVTHVDPARGHVELDHGPIPSMKWPSMQMGFVVAEAGSLANLKRGDRVEFEFRGEPNKDGDYVVTRIVPMKR